ncbi:hypothetical protein [Sphingobium yanoikuyae]|uniref:hypothetical protein n=1 Tax=Sphingobium yanoikuyae TaxID=13690 RepID=UPI0028AA5DAD|nr:hypothetical protein [Sphingobium yanoikuyae]
MQDLSSLLYSPALKEPGSHDPYTPRQVRALDLKPLFSPNNRHAWIGDHPPFACTAINLGMATGFRAAAQLHGQFDVVWCATPDAHGGHNWPILLDEALRLMGRTGHLVLHIPSNFGEMARIKNYLKRKFGFRCNIVDELALANGIQTIIAVERTLFDAACARDWSVAILASGHRTPIVEKMVHSIRLSPHGSSIDILIFGPCIDSLADQGVRFLDEADYDINPLLNEISKKKNILGAEARHENLLICHDRYYLDADFFKSFDDFGTDFDFATVHQSFPDGQTFPAIGQVGGLQLDRLHYVPDTAGFIDDAYVNGGFFIIKASVLKALPLNDLCFWNQAEDAEFSVLLRQHGIIARYNPVAQAITDGISKKHCAHFRSIEDDSLLLLGQNRGALRGTGKYHWRYPDYMVSERDAQLRSDESLALFMDNALGAPSASMSARLLLRSTGAGGGEYRTATTGWTAIATEGDTVLRVRHGLTDAPLIELRDPASPNHLPDARSAPQVIADICLLDAGPVSPILAHFKLGAYPREDYDGQYLNWLENLAELTLLNPNDFPVSSIMSFAYRHILDDGSTDLIMPDGQVVTMKGEASSDQTLLCLAPGITTLRFRAGSHTAAPPLPNEKRKLWMAMINLRIDLIEENWAHDDGQGMRPSWPRLTSLPSFDRALMALGDAADMPAGWHLAFSATADDPGPGVMCNHRYLVPTGPDVQSTHDIPLDLLVKEGERHMLLTPGLPDVKLTLVSLDFEANQIARSQPEPDPADMDAPPPAEEHALDFSPGCAATGLDDEVAANLERLDTSAALPSIQTEADEKQPDRGMDDQAVPEAAVEPSTQLQN